MGRIKILLLLMVLCFSYTAQAQSDKSGLVRMPNEQGEIYNNYDNKDKLVIVWSTDDPNTARNLVFMYSYNSLRMNWFKEVTVIIWGASSRLVATDKSIQEEVAKLIEAGVKVRVCVACATRFGVADKMRELGYDVQGMGAPLTKYIKQNYSVVTF